MFRAGTPRLQFRWLMNQKHLELLELVPGARDFTVVQPTELEDPGEFLVPGAIVLTVGISFAGEPERLTGYCRALADAGAAAVGLGTGLVFDEVPAELVVGARAAGLAVFEVPRHIPFASILGAVEDERTRLGNIERERLINAQELLSQYAVTGGLEALGRQLSEVLDSAVAIVDNDARSVLREDRGTRCATAAAVDAVRAGRDSAGPTTDGDGFTHTYRMSRHGERFHVLAVETPGPLGPSGRALIRHAAGLADILIQRPAHLRAARAEMNTLATYLRGHSRITTCAETLGVHRHTVRTRLARIREVTEVDLSDPVACAELLLVIVTRTGGE